MSPCTPGSRATRRARCGRLSVVRGLLLALAVPVLVAALPLAPPPIELSAVEEAALATGEIVLRSDSDEVEGTGVVDVAAPPAAVMAAVMDLPARVADIDGLQTIEIFDQRPGLVATRWTLRKLGITVNFAVIYEFDLDTGWCTFHLDPSQPGDIEASEGSYQVYAHGTGSRLVYRSKSSLPAWIPMVVRRKVDSSSARELLGGIRSRAEAG